MIERQIETQPVLGSKDINISDRANEPNSRRPSQRLLSWYLAQLALLGLKYSLTAGGYVILP
jgi:hypothetical protein